MKEPSARFDQECGVTEPWRGVSAKQQNPLRQKRDPRRNRRSDFGRKTVTPARRLFFYCFQPAGLRRPFLAKPLVYPETEGAAPSPRGSRRQSCRPTAGGRNLNHMTQRLRRGPLGRGPLSLTATAILLREDRNRDSLLQFGAATINPQAEAWENDNEDGAQRSWAHSNSRRSCVSRPVV